MQPKKWRHRQSRRQADCRVETASQRYLSLALVRGVGFPIDIWRELGCQHADSFRVTEQPAQTSDWLHRDPTAAEMPADQRAENPLTVMDGFFSDTTTGA